MDTFDQSPEIAAPVDDLFDVEETAGGVTTIFKAQPGGGRIITARGGGKGGGGGGSPEESPDSLFSIQYARVLFAVCEGEIEGPAKTGLKWVTFDNSALENDDGSLNYKNVRVEYRNGTLDQTYISGFPGVESEIPVNMEVTKATPVIKTISNPNADAVRITMAWQGLSVIDSSGDVRPAWGEYAVDVRLGLGAWSEVLYVKFSGKTNSKYQRSHRIENPGGTPWGIRVRRLYPDAASGRRTDKSYWESLTEINDQKFSYPMTAMYGVEIDAKQFPNVPTVGFDLKLLKVKVPTNYDPLTRVYTGVWDGTFKIAWTDNPAWVFYDAVWRKRYGLGRYIDESAIDKWSLYTIAKYCDELVPDGFGGLEPRFTCNIYIQAQEAAQKVLGDLASIFRAMLFWGAGQVVASQDAPADPVALYTTANVKDGKFIRQGASISKRFTVARVTCNDPGNFYKTRVEYVEDPDGIARYGIRETEVIAMGCTSRGQARRLGKWIIYSSLMESGVITWRVGLEGLKARPGQYVQVADNKKVGKRIGGRIVSATSTTLTLDKAFTIAAGVTYSITVIGLDGAPQKRTITTPASTTASITVSTAFDTIPQANAIWIIAEPSLVPEIVRLIGVAKTDTAEYELTGLIHNPSKFAFVEKNELLENIPTSSIDINPQSPKNISAVEYLYETGGGIASGALISWDNEPTAVFYDLTYKVNDEQAVTILRQPSVSLDLRNLYPSMLSVSVRSVNLLGRVSPWATASIELLGKTAPPADPTEFGLAIVDEQTAIVSFNESPDLDVRIGGYWVIRHSPDRGPGIGWQDGFEIARIPGSARTATIPLLSGSYILRALDSSNVYSLGSLKVETDAPNVLAYEPIATIEESPGFTGAKSGTVAAAGLLFIESDTRIDDVPDFDAIASLDLLGTLVPSGTYDFASIIDLGQVYASVRLQASIRSTLANLTDQIDSRSGTIDTWDSIDGTDASLSNVRLLVSSTPDNPAGSPVWSVYQPFVSGHYAGRAFRVRAELTTSYANQQIYISQLSMAAQVPPRLEAQYNVTSNLGATPVTFGAPFATRPALSITAENMQTGDYYELSGQSNLGFTVTFKNAAGMVVVRVFDWIAKGQGELVI